MNQLKNTSFSDRITLANEAKKARLAAFKPKPMVKAEGVVDRAAEKAAELERVRAERAAAKEAARLEVLAQQEAELANKRSAIKARKALTAAEQKEKRDARYAARKARKN